MIEFQHNDGGRAAAGFKGAARDCACRAVSIATGKPYADVYKLLAEYAKLEKPRNNKARSSPRTGYHVETLKKVMADMGWRWVPTMAVGKGVTMHLDKDELPNGTIIVRLSRHYAAVIDGVLHDTYDSSRDGSRAVYGYWIKEKRDL